MFGSIFVAILYFWGVSMRARKILFPILLSLPILICLLFIWGWANELYNLAVSRVDKTPLRTWDREMLLASSRGKVDLVVSPEGEDVKRLVALLRESKYGDRILNVVFKEDQKSMDKYVQETAGTQSRGWNITLGVHVREMSKTRLDYSIHHVPRETSWPMALEYSKGPKPLNFERSFYFNNFLPLQVALNEAYAKEHLAVNMRFWRISSFPYPAVRYAGNVERRTLIVFIALFLSLVGPLCLFVLLVVEEKRDGFKELLIINGAPRWMLDVHWLVFFALVTLPIYIVIASIIAGMQVLVYMDGLLILLIVTLVCWHAFSVTGLLMVFVHRPVVAIVIPLVWVFFDFTGGLAVVDGVFSALGYLSGLNIILTVYQEFENANEMLNLINAFKNPLGGLSVGLTLVIMLLSTILCVFLMIYLSPIFPGRYGVPKPWNWMCRRPKNVARASPAADPPEQIELISGSSKKSTLGSHSNKTNSERTQSRQSVGENSAIEGLKGAPVGLRATNVVKSYGRHTAVNGVSMVIPKNQNTVLLGHNGAGKTTLLSIFVGMTAASSGTFSTDRYVIFSDGNEKGAWFKKEMGYCPQHNMLFGKATPFQHLMLFGLLKGLSCEEARRKSQEILWEYQLLGAKDRKAKQLSGGMQRRLCFGIAVMNNPRYLFLDEPTSGLDLVSSRFVCDSLLARKGTCTVVISTHSMEEAELLGDYVAVMANGRLICYGSVPFLKKRYHTGYQLTIYHEKNAPSAKEIVTKLVPAAKLHDETNRTVTFTIAPDNLDRFPALLRELEAKKFRLSLTYSALADVFLKVQDEEGVKVNIDSIPTATDDQKGQAASVIEQIRWLFYLRTMWTLRNWKMSLFALIVPPLVGFMLYVVLTNPPKSESIFGESSSEVLTMGMYEGTTVLMATPEDGNENKNVTSALRSAIIDSGLKYVVTPTDELLVDSLLDRAEEDLMSYRRQVVFAFDTTYHPTALFSLTAYHSAPIALNALMNSILAGKSEIITRNIPIVFRQEVHDCMKLWFNESFCWILCLGIPMLLSGAYFVSFPRTDRLSFFRHLQMMTGVSTATYWLTLLVWNLLLYSTMILFLSLYLALFEYERGAGSTLTVIGLFLLYGLGCIPLHLILSLLFDKTTSAMLWMLIFFVVYVAAKFLGLALPFLDIKLLYFLPWVTFTEGAINILARDAYKNGCLCQGNACIQLFLPRAMSNLWLETVVLVADAILYTLILLIISSHHARRSWSELCREMLYQEHAMDVYYDDTRESDRSVVKEKIRVEKLRYGQNANSVYNAPKRNDPEPSISFSSSQKMQGTSESQRPASFIADSIGKMYTAKRAAVRDVTFTLQEGECFGLLGENGSGKTSTFRLLAGDLVPTKGDAVLWSFRLSHQRTEYMSRAGYCPQFDGLLHGLSANTHLKFYAGLRGTPRGKVKALANSWTKALDMEGISRRPCGTYSGGNKRKLSLALAMLGNINLVLLDEPSTGVDLLVTHRIWKIIKYSADANNLMVILSTHSMAECEAICDRLTIMIGGVMKCLGTAPQLKAQLGARTSLRVKFNPASSPVEVEDMRRRIENTFKPHIRISSPGEFSVTYTIDAAGWNMHEVFSTMDKLKNTNRVIEDFAAGDASLDQIFEHYVKENRN